MDDLTGKLLKGLAVYATAAFAGGFIAQLAMIELSWFFPRITLGMVQTALPVGAFLGVIVWGGFSWSTRNESKDDPQARARYTNR